MDRIPWKDRYSIHYKEIDQQHKELLAILNEVADLHQAGVATDALAGLFHRLCQYALVHFATEERYMAAAGYPDLARHQAEHGGFIQDLLRLNQSYEPDDPRLAEATFTFVKDWYLHHIIESDQDYTACLRSYRSRAKTQGVLFSLDGVICRRDETRFHHAAAEILGLSPQDVEERLGSRPSLVEGYQAGLLDTAEFLAGLGDLFGRNPLEDGFQEAYANVYDPIEDSLEIVRRLKPRYRVGLLADTTPLRLNPGLEGLGIPKLFDALILPCEVKTSGPDGALFDGALQRLEILAEECLYLDSRPAWVLAASGHLMRGLSVPAPERLVEVLQRVGIDI